MGEEQLGTNPWIVYTVVGMLVATGSMVIKHVLNRVDKADEKQDRTDEFIRTTMLHALDDNTIMLAHFGVVMRKMKCVRDSDAIRLGDMAPSEEDIEQFPAAAVRAVDRRREREQRTEKAPNE